MSETTTVHRRSDFFGFPAARRRLLRLAGVGATVVVIASSSGRRRARRRRLRPQGPDRSVTIAGRRRWSRLVVSLLGWAVLVLLERLHPARRPI
ncbi:hypothetical protein HBB16_12045 [Pseudonocardia sp. MCCB 268]|nr:hypothetical protein [Pseudonocardia cytotoxica]